MRTFLLIDGHNFSYRNLYALPKPRSGKYLDKKHDRDLFKQQLITHLLNLFNTWRSVMDGAVLVWDFGSWRKELLKSEFAGEVEYKGTRNTEERVNTKYFAECMGEFKEWVKRCKVAQCELYGAEGDDWICAITHRLNGRGDKVIIYSNDGDLNQLVVDGVMQLSKNGEKYNLFVSENDAENLSRHEHINVIDSMLNGGVSAPDAMKMLIGEMVVSKKVEIVPVKSQVALFKKIMVGDKSDNIPSVCSVVKNGRTYGISEKMCDAILEDFYAKSGIGAITEACYSNDELSGLLCESILSVAKEKIKYGGDLDSVRHGLARNIKYVVLGMSTAPEKVVDGMSMRIDNMLADGGYVNWSAIEQWRNENVNVVKKVEVNGLSSVLGTEGKDTDWSFIKKDDSNGKLF